MPLFKPGETTYYLDDYADEVLPESLEEPTLEGWAKWIAGGGDDGPDDEGPFVEDGKILNASSLTFLDDVEVRRLPAHYDEEKDEFDPELEFSPPLPDRSLWDFAALRMGPGMGWGGDDILDPDDLEDGLCGALCPLLEPGDEGILALAKSTNVRLRYRADPPRLEVVEETVQ